VTGDKSKQSFFEKKDQKTFHSPCHGLGVERLVYPPQSRGKANEKASFCSGKEVLAS
jgi:hypothetical protein